MQSKILCRQCKEPIDPTDPFCKLCGAKQQITSQQPQPTTVSTVSKTCQKCGGQLSNGICAWCVMQLAMPPTQPQKRSVGILAGVVIIAAVCVVIAIMAIQNRPEPMQKKTTPPIQSQHTAQGASGVQPTTYSYSPPQQQLSPTNQQPDINQDTAGLDRMVGDYNSYLRRLDDSAAKQDAYVRTELDRTTDNEQLTETGNKRVEEFYRFTADAGTALQLYGQIAASPLFAQNYRETTMLSASAQSRLGIPDAQSVGRAANLRYIEKR